MTETVPEERRRTGFPSNADMERSPANIATPLVYLASEEGKWVTGKCFGISGYRITLYSQIEPQIILQGDKPWEVDGLFQRFEQTFGSAFPDRQRPAAG